MFGVFNGFDKKNISSAVYVCIERASSKLGLSRSPQETRLLLNSLRFTDTALRYFTKKNGWNIKQLSDHCRAEVLASFVCLSAYFEVNPTDKELGAILQEAIKVGLSSIGISNGDSPAKKIEIAVIIAVRNVLVEEGLNVEEFLGFSVGN